MMSPAGTSRTWRNVRHESVVRIKADMGWLALSATNNGWSKRGFTAFLRRQGHHSIVDFGTIVSGLSTGFFPYSHEIESAFAVVGPTGSIRAVRPTLPQGS